VLELSYFQGMSHGQIAESLGLPVGTVKSRILAGMRSMRSLLPVIHAAMKA
jgi:RNA polymerase sigma-70 factor (ECF subfamily)